MSTITIGWLNKCRCGNKSHTVKTARGNESGLWDDDAVKCNSCGRGGVIQVCEGQARVLWETDEEMAEGKPMSTINKEWLQKKIAELEATRDDIPFGLDEGDSNTLAALRIALASLEAEPVAIVEPSDYVTAAQLVGEEPRSKAVRPLFEGALSVGQKLYAAPRLDNPFCPKCGGTGLADSGGTHPWGEPIYIECDCRSLPPAPASLTDEQRAMLRDMDDEIVAELEEEERICRAAMLQGADGNSPAGWVACSERMPEGMTDVHISNGHDVGQGWWDGDTWQTQHDYYSVPGDVTHWMTLPAAPQQEE
ncbi:DUF551 domain-containing protein [Enterobacter hormaechei]|nr:DUF551 domain-containing protein [Enterobacter hormaechei subsp. steigerwaltii]ELX8345484.1 DUF551 domain-containing protein [Enterobacter hormaechei]ELZ2868174.1 DUF551 domain-containing protein [Enterobacter hormaechei]